MVLSACRPSQHPRTGIYQFRRVVPERLRPLVGKREVKISLATRDASEARRLHAAVAARVEAEWAGLTGTPPATVSQPQLVAWAAEMRDDLLRAHATEAGDPEIWRQRLMAIQQAIPPLEREPGVEQQWPGSWGFLPPQIAPFRVGNDVDAFLAGRNTVLGWQQRRELCALAARALAEAYRTLLRRASGGQAALPVNAVPPATIGWRALYDLYVREAKPKPSTRKRQEGILTAFFTFLGHDLPASVTEADALAWKEKRLNEVSLKTVEGADLAHPRIFFGWCKANRKLPLNPFAEIRVTGAGKNKASGGGMREYEDWEARKVLSATLWPPTKNLSVEGQAVRRWIPWICAYSGARVNEITQLRHEDIVQVHSRDRKQLIWVMRILPEAGTVKDDERREVAIHPHLIEQGFLDYVLSRKGKRLFYDPGKGKGGSVAHPQHAKAGERLAAWIRSKVGITDTKIAPNHAWRHLFRSTLLAAGVQEQVINGIDGHAAETEGQKYGRIWPEVSLAAVSCVPAYRLHGLEIEQC